MASSAPVMTYRREGDSYGVGGGGDVSAPALELRASVLEAAVSLGFRNSVMKKWMDGDDDELATEVSFLLHGTPALTSPSTTSEESALSPASSLHPTTSTSAYPYPYPYPFSSSRTNGGTNAGKPGQSSGAGAGVGVRARNDPTLYINPNGNLGMGMGGRFSHDDDMMSANGSLKGPLGKLALAVPPPKNKLRKQKSTFPGIGVGANGYESDGGYISEVSKKSKSRKGLAWRRKNDYEDGGADSDTGYLSEAFPSSTVAKARAKRKAKEKEKEKRKEGERVYVPRDAPSPMLPPMNLDSDPGALLATIKASVLPDSKSNGSAMPSGSGSGLGSRMPEPALPPASRAFTSLSDNGHGPVSVRSATDGYLTDSGSSEKRGRSKKKGKNNTKANKSRAGSPDADGDSNNNKNTDSETRTPTKKKSLFRLMGRSISRDAKDRDRGRERARSEEEVPPMPEPPRPPMPLPIAERFARSGAGTPVGNASASSSPSRLGSNPTDAQPGLRSSGSLSTLVPPTLRDPTFSRSESPWSYKSAPSRFGYADLEGMEVSSSGRRDDGRDSNSNSNSLELPRERRNSGGWSPFVVIPRDRTDSEMNANDTNGNAGVQVQREAERAGSPVRLRSVSPIVTAPSVNANQAGAPGPSSPDTNKSPTKRIGKLFNPFGQSSKSDDGHSNESHISNNSNTSSSAALAPPTSFSSSSKPAISGPNPHLTRRGSLSLRFPSPMEIAAALTGSARGAVNGNANANVVNNDANGNAKNLTVTGGGIRPKTPESFIIIDEDEGVPTPMRQQRFADANASAPSVDSSSSPYLSVSSTAAGDGPSSPTRPNGTSTSLSTRRRALLNGLGLNVTPTQSRSNTPTPINTNVNPDADPNDDGIPNEDEVRAARASVLAYYNVPPPSPPPTGPLPAPPHQLPPSSSPSGTRPVSPMQESNRQTLLSPGRAFASRSPSPLGLTPNGNNRYSSRSPSPGLGVGPGVKRGRESPFPTRPILPPQNRQELVERVERYKALYASAEGSGSDENGLGSGSGGSGLDQKELSEFLDRHSSAYIRQARARGEKRVYFDTKHYSIRDAYYYGDEIVDEGEADVDSVGFEYGDGYPRDVTIDGEVDDVDVDPVIPNINVYAEPEAEQDGSVYEDDFDDEADERLRYSRQSLRDEFEDADADKLTAKDKEADGLGDEDSSTDRRSFAASSVYSQHSVLDADKSARFREGLVRRVAAMYSGGRKDEGRLLREEIPEVPRVPNEFRKVAGGGAGAAAAGQLGLKATSSPYRF
ncbi:hypothetical protein ACEPAF_2026 [Sanghuangporus sanghuang]